MANKTLKLFLAARKATSGRIFHSILPAVRLEVTLNLVARPTHARTPCTPASGVDVGVIVGSDFGRCRPEAGVNGLLACRELVA